MRVPFPLALNVGTDIVAYHRLAQATTPASHRLPRLVNRVLHPKEVAEMNRRFPDWCSLGPSDDARQKKIYVWLAGRWAAKEAAKKAWGAHLISFRDLRTEVLPNGEVNIICQSFDEKNWTIDQHSSTEQVAKLSISHDGDYAMATVIASPLHEDIVALLSQRKVVADHAVNQEPLCLTTYSQPRDIAEKPNGGCKMIAQQKFQDNSRFQHDPRHTAVDEYANSHLLKAENNPLHEALQHTYDNSLANGCPDISTTAAHGKFLALQVKIARARNILEVGTLGGYSAIWMASAHPDIRITTIEINPQYKALAESHFKKAGVAHQINVLLGSAQDVLTQLGQEVQAGKRDPFDFAFIDADKDNNLTYFKLTVDAVKSQTPIFVDNVVRHGDLADEEAAQKDSRVQGARNLVENVGKMPQVEAVVIQTVSEKDYDGFMLAMTR